MEYGSEYEEPGYKATYFGKDITDKVYVTGKVDTKTLGTNQLKYNIRKNRIVISKKRYVRVVDTTKPEIECEDKIEIYEGSEVKLDELGKITDNSKEEIKPEIDGDYDLKKSGEYKPVTVYTDPLTGKRIAPDVGWSHNPASGLIEGN